MNDLPSQALSPTSAASRKHSLPHQDGTSAKRLKAEPGPRVYENCEARDSSRAHFGDSHQSHEYYGPVYQYKDQVQPTDIQSSSSTKRRETLESLKFDQMSDRYASISPAHAKTCQWLFERQEYKDWLDPTKRPDHGGFQWIKGKPGAGKSTLMKCAYQHAQKTQKDTNLVSFFFTARGNALEKSTEGMYRSLLHQILEKVPRLHSVLDTQRQHDIWPVETLSTLFREAVKCLAQDHLTCYIDALDECDETEIRNMVEVFQELTDPELAESTNFHVCFSSRHYPHISIETCRELILDDQEGHEDDIASYVRNKLRRVKVNARSKSDIALEITQRASGIFLWVILVVRILIEDCDRGHAHKIKARLHEIPDGLDDLFQDIIRRGTQEDTYLISTLQWIMFAVRPLSAEEFYNAIIYSPAVEAGLEEESMKIDPETTKSFLLNSSKGLAETTRGKFPKVQFIHESVRDYLRTTGLQRLSPDLNDNLPGLSHEFLKNRCLQFLSDEVYRHQSLHDLPPAKSEKADAMRAEALESFPFLEYAVSNVLHHAEYACEHGISQEHFVQEFPVYVWSVISNLFEKHMVRRYSPTVTKTYVFADRCTPYLLDILLCQGGTDLSARLERHRTALSAAVYGSSVETVSVILKHGALSSATETPQRLFKIAVERRSSKVLQLLIDSAGPLDSRTTIETVFIQFAHSGNLDAARFLAAHCSKDDLQDRVYATALLEACQEGHERVVEMLLEEGANSNGEAGGPLYAACAQGYKKIVQILLEKGADVNAQGGYYGSALQAACAGRHKKTVEILLDNGVNVNTRGDHGTALYLACDRANPKIVRMLLERGANVNAYGGHFGSTLRAACATGHRKIVEMLLEQGVYVNTQYGRGGNALDLACDMGDVQIAKLLLEKGADITLRREREERARSRGQTGIVKLLQSQGERVTR